jgi:tRNA G10  N-methylase Trm11
MLAAGGCCLAFGVQVLRLRFACAVQVHVSICSGSFGLSVPFQSSLFRGLFLTSEWVFKGFILDLLFYLNSLSFSVFMGVDTNFDRYLHSLLVKYSRSHRPIEISFREIVSSVVPDRATHLIHTYPAKLLAQIPYFFLNSTLLASKGDIIHDPFCGSGTVLLEAILSGRSAIGADSNPLARLISKVKTTDYDVRLLQDEKDLLIKKLKRKRNSQVQSFPNIDYWFLPNVSKELASISELVNEIEDEDIQDFFSVCLSNCVKKVSLADPRVSVPVRLRKDQYDKLHPFRKKTEATLKGLNTIDVKEKFVGIVDSNIKRFTNYSSIKKGNKPKAVKIYDDARNLSSRKKHPDESVDLIITSPPYAGAQKYIRASSLSLGWLKMTEELSLRDLEKLNIGRENYLKSEFRDLRPTNIKSADKVLKNVWTKNPLRAHIASMYLMEMKDAFSESVRVLKPGGYIVLVVGNNMICDLPFNTQEYLTSILKNLGLEVRLKLIDDIKSYGLMTKRNKTANIITREWITVFEKV